MSNNIYDILKKMATLESPKQALKESKDMSTVKELHNESKKSSATNKGSIAEAVKAVETQLSEKYMGFKKTVAAIKKGGSAENPEAVAAAIGRKKYGKEKFQKAAAAGKKLGENQLHEYGEVPDDGNLPADYFRSGNRSTGAHMQYAPHMTRRGLEKLEKLRNTTVDPKTGKEIPGAAEELAKKYDHYGNLREPGTSLIGPVERGLRDVNKAIGSAAEKYLGPAIDATADTVNKGADYLRSQFTGAKQEMEEDSYNEDMLSSKQKKFAALAEPKDKITYADKIAGAKKKQKDEGNEFSGELVKARAQGKDSFEVDGKEYPVKEGRSRMREGWEEMQKYLEKKRGPESKGGEGKKSGSRYGGSAQKDDDEETDGEGQAVVKKKGRPKGTGGGAKFSFKKPKD